MILKCNKCHAVYNIGYIYSAVCLLSFNAVSFVFQFAIQKYKDSDIQNYNFPVALYGCEAWSLTLREEGTLRVCQNRVLRKIFGPKSDEGTEEYRKLSNEGLNELYSLQNVIRVIK